LKKSLKQIYSKIKVLNNVWFEGLENREL